MNQTLNHVTVGTGHVRESLRGSATARPSSWARRLPEIGSATARLSIMSLEQSGGRAC